MNQLFLIVVFVSLFEKILSFPLFSYSSEKPRLVALSEVLDFVPESEERVQLNVDDAPVQVTFTVGDASFTAQDIRIIYDFIQNTSHNLVGNMMSGNTDAIQNFFTGLRQLGYSYTVDRREIGDRVSLNYILFRGHMNNSESQNNNLVNTNEENHSDDNEGNNSDYNEENHSNDDEENNSDESEDYFRISGIQFQLLDPDLPTEQSTRIREAIHEIIGRLQHYFAVGNNEAIERTFIELYDDYEYTYRITQHMIDNRLVWRCLLYPINDELPEYLLNQEENEIIL